MTNSSQFTLVMVDDNADEVFITRKLVRRDGIVNNFISERTPENLFGTLESLSNIGVDADNMIILLDINMPRIDGFEVLKSIRAHAVFGEALVLMLSASDDEADINRAMDLGATGYLVKPFRSEHFFAALTGAAQIRYQLHAAE